MQQIPPWIATASGTAHTMGFLRIYLSLLKTHTLPTQMVTGGQSRVPFPCRPRKSSEMEKKGKQSIGYNRQPGRVLSNATVSQASRVESAISCTSKRLNGEDGKVTKSVSSPLVLRCDTQTDPNCTSSTALAGS